jgi:hypothetical protein
VQEQEIELSIGDSIQIGQHTVTVIDIEGTEVCFRIEHEEEQEEISVGGMNEFIPR